MPTSRVGTFSIALRGGRKYTMKMQTSNQELSQGGTCADIQLSENSTSTAGEMYGSHVITYISQWTVLLDTGSGSSVQSPQHIRRKAYCLGSASRCCRCVMRRCRSRSSHTLSGCEKGRTWAGPPSSKYHLWPRFGISMGLQGQARTTPPGSGQFVRKVSGRIRGITAVRQVGMVLHGGKESDIWGSCQGLPEAWGNRALCRRHASSQRTSILSWII